MKKTILTVLFFAAAIFAVHSQTGIIREMTGEVEIKLAGESAFRSASAGTLVAQDTVVSTGFRSTAVIVIGSNEIIVRPLTRLTLAEISSSANTETLNVNLQSGRVRVAVHPPSGSRAVTSVQTPTATASVRGTEFGASSDGNFDTTQGNVIITDNTGFPVSLTFGFKTSVDSSGNLKDPLQDTFEGYTPNVPPGSGEAGEYGSSPNSPGSGGGGGGGGGGDQPGTNINMDVFW